MQYGIDISHHQPVASLDWPMIARGSKFCIVRNSYGRMKDRVTEKHVANVRAAGLKVGLYHFFRPSQDAQKQLDVFLHGLGAAGIGPGDIVPALDIEADPLPSLAPVTKAWQDGVRLILAGLKERYGNALVYITQREFNQLGAPEWLLTFPLWVAHYTGAAKPATPGSRPYTIWQHRVGTYLLDGGGGYFKPDVLDQNRAVDLPLIDWQLGEDVPEAEHVDDDDTGLEDLIAQHNQALLDNFVLTEAARIERISSSQAIREYEEAGLVDDEPTGGGSSNS